MGVLCLPLTPPGPPSPRDAALRRRGGGEERSSLQKRSFLQEGGLSERITKDCKHCLAPKADGTKEWKRKKIQQCIKRRILRMSCLVLSPSLRSLPFPTFFAWTKMATIRWNPQGRAHTAGGWAAASPLEPTYLFLFCKSLDLLLKRSVSCSTLTPPAPLSLLSQRRGGSKTRTLREKRAAFLSPLRTARFERPWGEGMSEGQG